jgi:polar amino acid transport system substrate-binding protein
MISNLRRLGLVVTVLHAGSAYGADSEIVPTGKLRYGLNTANAALSWRAADGSVGGVAIDIGRFVAGKLGVPFEPIAYATTGDFTRSFDKGEWDITVVGTSPAAKTKFYFTPDVLLVDYVFLARPGRHFTSIADVDQRGIKVGASQNGSGSQYLRQSLKFAELELGPGSVESEVQLLRSGAIDVYGANTNNLLLVREQLPDATFVPGAFLTVHFAGAMAKTKSPQVEERLAAFLREAVTNGLIQEAIERDGLKGVRIAP